MSGYRRRYRNSLQDEANTKRRNMVYGKIVQVSNACFLPDSILVHCFQYLDFKSILTCRLVCKSFTCWTCDDHCDWQLGKCTMRDDEHCDFMLWAKRCLLFHLYKPDIFQSMKQELHEVYVKCLIILNRIKHLQDKSAIQKRKQLMRSVLLDKVPIVTGMLPVEVNIASYNAYFDEFIHRYFQKSLNKVIIKSGSKQVCRQLNTFFEGVNHLVCGCGHVGDYNRVVCNVISYQACSIGRVRRVLQVVSSAKVHQVYIDMYHIHALSVWIGELTKLAMLHGVTIIIFKPRNNLGGSFVKQTQELLSVDTLPDYVEVCRIVGCK